jgi:glycosyltransferase involved in cell wall biosynthesis
MPEPSAGGEPAKISILIPSYREPALGETVQRVREKMDALHRPYEIVVIDDGGPGHPAEGVEPDETVRIHRNRVNRGYGASLKEGIRLATGDYVLMMDADGQHRPDDLPRFLEHVDREADAVLGSRQKLMHSHWWRMPGKWLIKRVASFLVGRPIPDPNCGFRAIRRDLIERYMRLCPNGFSFSTTSTLILLSDRRDTVFLPLDVEARIGRSTVKLADGFRTLLGLLRIIMLFAPLRVLLPPSFVLLLLGLGFLVYDVIRVDITQATVLLLTTGMIFFFFGLVADQIAAMRKDML